MGKRGHVDVVVADLGRVVEAVERAARVPPRRPVADRRVEAAPVVGHHLEGGHLAPGVGAQVALRAHAERQGRRRRPAARSPGHHRARSQRPRRRDARPGHRVRCRRRRGAVRHQPRRRTAGNAWCSRRPRRAPARTSGRAPGEGAAGPRRSDRTSQTPPGLGARPPGRKTTGPGHRRGASGCDGTPGTIAVVPRPAGVRRYAGVDGHGVAGPAGRAPRAASIGPAPSSIGQARPDVGQHHQRRCSASTAPRGQRAQAPGRGHQRRPAGPAAAQPTISKRLGDEELVADADHDHRQHRHHEQGEHQLARAARRDAASAHQPGQPAGPSTSHSSAGTGATMPLSMPADPRDGQRPGSPTVLPDQLQAVAQPQDRPDGRPRPPSAQAEHPRLTGPAASPGTSSTKPGSRMPDAVGQRGQRARPAAAATAHLVVAGGRATGRWPRPATTGAQGERGRTSGPDGRSTSTKGETANKAVATRPASAVSALPPGEHGQRHRGAQRRRARAGRRWRWSGGRPG